MTTRRGALGAALVALSVSVAACGDSGSGSVEDAEIAEVRDALADEARATVARALYETRGSRDHFLELAQQDDPEVWAEINADGEVTLEEFRSIPDVQDAVNIYGGDVVQFFEKEMVAATDGSG